MNRSKSRLRKIHCPGCGAILYGSATSLRKAIAPTVGLQGGLQCGCGGFYIAAHLEDREAIERSNEK